MTLAIIAIIVGFAGLIWSADRFVAGAAGIALNLGMAPIMIGLTIVAFGTSAPEIIVSINAALENAGELAIGNALGSNLANVGLVLGLTALVSPIPIPSLVVKREIPLLVIATLLVSFFIYDQQLTPFDGVAMLVILTAIYVYLVNSKAHQPNAELEADVEHLPNVDKTKAMWLFIIGLVMLIISSRVLVWGAREIALGLGISELIVGLTVVAIGTSLPELAATIASALKGHHEIAIGNIVGSNLFNLLAVMAMPALISPSQLEAEVFYRDYLSMTFITLLLAVIIGVHYLAARKKQPAEQDPATARSGSIGRLEGVLLLSFYGAYYYLIFTVSS
jgi:cation:H+ antiporter